MAIKRLPRREREVLVLREFQELTYWEIAELLDIPIGTVMSRLYGARKRLFVATVPFSSISSLPVARLVTGAEDWRRVRRLARTVFVIAGLTILAMVALAG